MFKNIPLIIGLSLLPFLAMAQGGSNNYSERPTAEAVEIETAPQIDGDVINDPVWQQIATFAGLTQVRPSNGQVASEKTEIRIAYNSNTFFLSVVCFDSEPEKLVVQDMRRDASLDNTDAFIFIVDTYHDNQNGFVFGTNSQGIEYDAQVDNEGQGNFNANRQQGGVIGGFNLNWDASWEVQTEVGDYGWSAEFAIPLRTLRFKSGENLTWGFNAQRIIRKTNEVAYWAPLPIQFDLKRLSLAGDITGMNLQSPGNLKLVPYLLTEVNKDFSVSPAESGYEGFAGMDLKYSVTPSVTLDLTYNTDFAQVEVDDQQVNLDRFNLFFPEKRPFFLENAGIFSVGSPGEVDLFFSRKIGITENGVRVPIIGGGRLSGRINKTNIGFLSMWTNESKDYLFNVFGAEDDIPVPEVINNYTVARINHQYASRSSVGMAFVSKQGIGDTSDDGNRVFAGDVKLGIGKKAQVTGYFAKSESPGIEEDDHSYKLQAQYEWDGLNLNAAYTEVGEGFNPEVGFLLRPSFRKAEFLIFKQVRITDWFGFLEFRPHVSYRGYWDMDGFQQTGFLHIDNHWVWKNGFEVHTGINLTKEGVNTAFNIYENIKDMNDSVSVDPGTFDHSEAQIIFMTNASKPVYISTRHVLGGSFGGSRQVHSGTLGMRIGDSFNTEISYGYNSYDLVNGDFDTHLFGGRISYSFTPRIFLQSLIQYNSVQDLWLTNIRFSILKQANSGLFVVYNDVRKLGEPYNRSITLKYSHVIDIIN